MVVSNIFYVHPYLGKWSKLTNIFQMGWFNHQLGKCSIPGWDHGIISNCNFPELPSWRPLEDPHKQEFLRGHDNDVARHAVLKQNPLEVAVGPAVARRHFEPKMVENERKTKIFFRKNAGSTFFKRLWVRCMHFLFVEVLHWHVLLPNYPIPSMGLAYLPTFAIFYHYKQPFM